MKMSFDDMHQMHMLHYLILRAMSHIPEEQREKLLTAWGAAKDNHDIHLIVDGIELPVEPTFKSWEAEYDRTVREDATKLVEEKFESIQQKANDLSDFVDSLTKTITEKVRTELDVEILDSE